MPASTFSNVVFDGKGAAETRFQLKQVGVVTKGIRAVIRGEADATLVDPDQLVEAKKMEGRRSRSAQRLHVGSAARTVGRGVSTACSGGSKS